MSQDDNPQKDKEPQPDALPSGGSRDAEGEPETDPARGVIITEPGEGESGE